jgi:hypothetical protein
MTFKIKVILRFSMQIIYPFVHKWKSLALRWSGTFKHFCSDHEFWKSGLEDMRKTEENLGQCSRSTGNFPNNIQKLHVTNRFVRLGL